MCVTDVNRNNTKGDITAWLGAFIGTYQENVSLSEMRSVMTMFQKVVMLENEDTNPCGTSVCEQIIEIRLGDCTW